MSLEGKNRKEQYEIWKKRIRVARDLHRDKILKNSEKFICEYSGEANYNQDTGERYEQIAQVIMAVEERVQPHLFFQSPEFFAKAKSTKSEWEKREPLVAAMVNHQYQDFKESGYGIELENELCVLDARILGYGATKTSYEVEGDILREPAEQGILDKAKGLFTGESKKFIETPVITKEKGQVTERVSPLNLYLDPWATHVTKQSFTIHWMDVSKDKLRKPRYEQELIEKLEPSATTVPDYQTKSKEEQEKLKEDPDFKAYRIYEILDWENGIVHTIADGADDFIEFDAPLGASISWLWFMEAIDKVYPLAPLKYYRKRANEFSYIYSQISSQIDKFLPKIGINENALDAPNKERFKNGTLGTFVGFNGPPGANWNVIQPTVQADLFKYLALTKELLTIESGVPDVELATPQVERTATEANKIDKASQTQRFKPKKRVKGFLLNQARGIWKQLQKNAPYDLFVMVLGEQAASEWWNDPVTGKAVWTEDNLEGDFWLDFDVETVTPSDMRQKKLENNEAIDRVLNPAFKQALASDKKRLKFGQLAEKYFKENLGYRDMDNILEDLSVLEPSEEHDLWMHGEYPEISENEKKDPEMLLKHYQAHAAWVNSSVFAYLPPEIQSGAMEHLQAYEPYMPMLQRMMQKPLGGGPASANQSPAFGTPPRENRQPSPNLSMML